MIQSVAHATCEATDIEQFVHVVVSVQFWMKLLVEVGAVEKMVEAVLHVEMPEKNEVCFAACRLCHRAAAQHLASDAVVVSSAVMDTNMLWAMQ